MSDRTRNWVLSLAVLGITSGFLLAYFVGCSTEKPAGTAAPTCEGGHGYGDEWEEPCDGGTAKLICTSEGPKPLPGSTCRDPGPGGGGDGDGDGDDGNGDGGGGGSDGGGSSCDKVGFEKVKPILTTQCVSCHLSPKIDDYGDLQKPSRTDPSKTFAQVAVARLALPEANRLHMPPGKKLPADQALLLTRWVNGGALEQADCDDGDDDDDGGGEPRRHLDHRAIETIILNDLNDQVQVILAKRGIVPAFVPLKDPTGYVTTGGEPIELPVGTFDELEDIRYLLTANKVNEGASAEVLTTLRKGMDKALNSVNEKGTDMARATPVPGSGEAVWRIDLADFGLEGAKWRDIEAADRRKVISQTERGAIIRQLTATNEPYVAAENFMDVALHTSKLYYDLVGIPPKKADYLKKIGAEIDEDVRNAEAQFIGGNSSPIALNKNRLIIRSSLETSPQSIYWETHDVLPLGGDERNLQSHPLVPGTGGTSKLNLQTDGQELIVELPNGMHAYSLFDGKGNRIDAAPGDLVTNNRPGALTPTIVNADACFACHARGIIPMQDEILAHVQQNGLGNAADVALVKKVYRPAAENAATFASDNQRYAAKLREIDIDVNDPEPINAVLDAFKSNWDLTRFAAWLWLTPDEAKECINLSPGAKAQIGALTTPNGTVTDAQFVEAYPDLIIDCQLFTDDR